jgi:hypothetical protein
MTDDIDEVDCKTHGPSSATFICEHLLANPVQRWICNPPAEDDRWPDAWCADCEVHFQKEGEWNDNNSEDVNIKMVCSGCYESALARSVEYLTPEAGEAWDELVSDCHQALHEKQDALSREYEISKHKRWDWDQETAELVFSNDGVVAVRCRIVFIGSVSTKSNTWLWSWANYSLDESVRSPMDKVRVFGVEKDFPKLFVPKWQADEVDGWEMAGIAVSVLNAKGVYRTPTEYGFTYLAILDAQWTQ